MKYMWGMSVTCVERALITQVFADSGATIKDVEMLFLLCSS
jgi:hypothetical protein